jgi:hypothetical protein
MKRIRKRRTLSYKMEKGGRPQIKIKQEQNAVETASRTSVLRENGTRTNKQLISKAR